MKLHERIVSLQRYEYHTMSLNSSGLLYILVWSLSYVSLSRKRSRYETDLLVLVKFLNSIKVICKIFCSFDIRERFVWTMLTSCTTNKTATRGNKYPSENWLSVEISIHQIQNNILKIQHFKDTSVCDFYISMKQALLR